MNLRSGRKVEAQPPYPTFVHGLVINQPPGVESNSGGKQTLESLPAGECHVQYVKRKKCSLFHSLTEITLAILEGLPNTKTLRVLIHASPIAHELYRNHRYSTFTQVTMNEMHAKGIDFTPAAIAEVRTTPACFKQASRFVNGQKVKVRFHNTVQRHAIESMYVQLSARSGRVELSIDECKSLLKVKSIVRWELTPGPDPLSSDGRVYARFIGARVHFHYNALPTMPLYSALLRNSSDIREYGRDSRTIFFIGLEPGEGMWFANRPSPEIYRCLEM